MTEADATVVPDTGGSPRVTATEAQETEADFFMRT